MTSQINPLNPLTLQKEDSDGELTAPRKGLIAESSEESEDGMFALEKEDERKVKLLDMDQFEKDLEADDGLGEFQSAAVEKDQDDSDEDIKITQFNLKEEMEEGRFDENQNFIRYESEDDDTKAQDSWLEGVKKKDIEKAKRSHELQEMALKKDEKIIDPEHIPGMVLELINLLSLGDSGEDVCKRLNVEKRELLKKTKKKGLGHVSEDDRKKAKELEDRILRILTLSDDLETHLELRRVFSLTREELTRYYQKKWGKIEGSKKRRFDEAQKEDLSGKVWEFKWIGKDKIYGPYTTKEILDWKNTYFKGKVMVKHVDGQFVHIDEWSGSSL